jgi:hypothetical protein
MDPTICYQEMLAAYQNEEWETARDRALALKEWLDRGGFHPDDDTKNEVRRRIAEILRQTAHLG